MGASSRSDSSLAGSHPFGRWQVGGLVQIWGLYTLLALMFGTEAYLYSLGTRNPTCWTYRTFQSFAPWYAWALVTPLIVAATRRFRDAGWGVPRMAAAHSLTVLAVIPLIVGANTLLGMGIRVLQGADPGSPVGSPLSYWVAVGVRIPIIYAVIVGITCAVDYYRRFRTRELDAVRLESQLHQARLQAIRAQLHPHFLFNTLNAISSLIHDDPDAADTMVALLAGFLRTVVDDVERQEVTLREELALVEKYLAIEKVRFGDRLRVVIDAAPCTLDAVVPSLVLQPLVENAITHGLAPVARGGTVTVRATCEDETLRLTVVDDGRGLAGAVGSPPAEGVGLGTTRARLRQLHGDAGRIEVRAPREGGFVVDLRLPLRRHTGDLPLTAAGTGERP